MIEIKHKGLGQCVDVFHDRGWMDSPHLNLPQIAAENGGQTIRHFSGEKDPIGKNEGFSNQ